MKRSLRIILILAAILAVLCCSRALAQESGTLNEKITWSLSDDGTLTITGTDDMPDYNPRTNPSPFRLRTDINTVIIKNGITRIGSYTFTSCSNLASVQLTTSLTSIGFSAFYNCGLTAVEIPFGVTEISRSAFQNNTHLARVDLSATVTQIGADAFRASALTEILIPYSVTSIGDNAFGDCTALTAASISNAAASISDTAFSGCSQSLTIRGYTGSSAQTFASGNGFGFGLIKCGENLTADLSSDGTMLTISGTGPMWDYGPGYAFRYSPFESNTGITWLNLSDGVTRIGQDAFPNCENLKTLTLPDSLLSIGGWAFQGCNGLTTLSLPDSLTLIDACAFRYCGGLTAITIPAAVSTLSTGVFDGCSKLSEVTVPNKNLVFASNDIFRNCSASLVLRGYEGSTAQTYAADQGITFEPIPLSGTCGPNLTWSLDIDTGHLTIDGSGEMYNYSNTSWSNNQSPFYNNKDIRSVHMPYGVESIGDGAFEDCINLTSVDFPVNLTRIGSMAFYNCGLTGKLQIMYGTQSIGSSAFKFNPITGAVIPSSVIQIEDSVFENCSSLYDVEIHNPLVQIGYNVFRNCSSMLTLHCFTGATAETYAATYDLRSGRFRVGDNIICDMDSAGNVTITGSGPMYDYSFYTGVSPLCGQHAAMTAVISDGITTVGVCFFAYCDALTEVSLPDGLIRLENDVFDYCSSLRNVSIPDTVTHLGSEVFMETAVERITVPAGVHYLYPRVFAWCDKLEAVTILDPGAEIDDDAFFTPYDGPAVLPDNLTLYGWPGSTTETFALTYGIHFIPLAIDPEMVLPSDLQTIEDEAFLGIDAETVLIPGTVTTIIGDPFEGSAVRYIFGAAGSAAQVYAETYGYLFVAVTE